MAERIKTGALVKIIKSAPPDHTDLERDLARDLEDMRFLVRRLYCIYPPERVEEQLAANEDSYMESLVATWKAAHRGS